MAAGLPDRFEHLPFMSIKCRFNTILCHYISFFLGALEKGGKQ
jgi:hypothetical protein